MIRLFLDTETNGLPRGNKPPTEYPGIFPLEIAAVMEDSRWPQRRQYLVGMIDWETCGFEVSVPEEVTKINGITAEMLRTGIPANSAFNSLKAMILAADEVICHNIEFDWKVIQIWDAKFDGTLSVPGKERYCTMLSGVELARLPAARGGYKGPKLQELYQHLFSQQFEGAHGAMADCMAMRKCYLEMTRLGIPSTLGPFGG